MSCTSLKVAGSCTDQDFIFTDYALAASPAYTTVRVHHDRTCIHEDIDQSFFQSLSVNSLTCRNNKESYFSDTFFPLITCAPTRRSSIRPLLQDPRNASSILIPRTSFAGARLSTKSGFATTGSTLISQMYILLHNAHPDRCDIQPLARVHALLNIPLPHHQLQKYRS